MTIPVNRLSENNFAAACEITGRITVHSPTSFEIPSASRLGVSYLVSFTFDLSPGEMFVACPCKAGERGLGCRHAARALEVMRLLAENDIHFAAPDESEATTQANPTNPQVEYAVRLASGVINAGEYAGWDERIEADRALWNLIASVDVRAEERRCA